MVKRVPAPGVASMSMRPPIALTSARTTSMPMPRPDSVVTSEAVEKPGVKISWASSRSVGLRPSGSRPRSRAALLDLRVVQAGAVIREAHDDFVAFLAHLDDQLAGLGLAGLDALGARLDAVRDRVAQQVLHRRRHPLQHAAIDLGVAALEFHHHALVRVLARLAHDPIEAVADGGELHHPDAHQVLLQAAAHLALARQVLRRRFHRAQRVLLDGGDVVDRLRQHLRQFLEAGVAIELERIEIRMRVLRMRDLRLDLVVRLDLDLAQLRAQAG